LPDQSSSHPFPQYPSIIIHLSNEIAIGQRIADGYISATAMCKATGKEWSNYRQNQATAEFLEALASSLGIPRDLIVQVVTTGPNDQRGTWVHPRVAIHLAMWCSATFAVQVTGWVEEWYATRRNPLVADALSPCHAMLNLIREVKGLLQDLEMYGDQDQLVFADQARNVLLAASEHIALPASPASQEPTESPRMWSVGDRIVELGYPQRLVNMRDRRSHRYLMLIGKRVAGKYRQRHGRSPMKATRYVDGAPREVGIYLRDDLDLLDSAIEEILGTPPSRAVTEE
jgi:hypothetical protein